MRLDFWLGWHSPKRTGGRPGFDRANDDERWSVGGTDWTQRRVADWMENTCTQRLYKYTTRTGWCWYFGILWVRVSKISYKRKIERDAPPRQSSAKRTSWPRGARFLASPRCWIGSPQVSSASYLWCPVISPTTPPRWGRRRPPDSLDTAPVPRTGEAERRRRPLAKPKLRGWKTRLTLGRCR